MASARDIDALARTMLGEAANQGSPGMQAVGNVAVNRLKAGGFGNSVYEVVHAPSQFSAWNPATNGGNELVNVPANSPSYQRAYAIAQQVIDGSLPDVTYGATYYHTPAVHPSWDKGMSQTAVIGGHVFYSPHPVPPADVPAGAPNHSGGPDDRALPPIPKPSPIDPRSPGFKPVPLAPAFSYGGPKNVSGSPDDRGLVTPTRVPLAPFSGASATGNANGPVAPIPATLSKQTTELRNGVQPVDPAATPAPISGVDKPTVTINGHTYIVGQTYPLGNGATFVPRADGTMDKTASTPRAMTPIQLLLNKDHLVSDVNQAQNAAGAVATGAQGVAGSVASSAKSAATSLGSLFGNIGGLFHGGSAPSPVPSLPNPYQPGQGPFKSAAPSVPQTAGPVGQSAGGGFFTPAANTNASGSPDDRGSGGANLPFSYAVPPAQRHPAPASAPAPAAPISRIVQVANPAYAAWAANQRAPAANGSAIGAVGANGFTGGAISIPKAPAPVAAPPPKTISHVVTVPQTAGPVGQQAAAGPIAPLPQTPGNGYNYLPDGKGGYVKVGQVNPALSPGNVYSVATGGPIQTINSGNYGSAGNNNASAAAQMGPGGSLTGI